MADIVITFHPKSANLKPKDGGITCALHCKLNQSISRDENCYILINYTSKLEVLEPLGRNDATRL